MLGSPLTARVLALAGERLAAGTPLADRILGWPGDVGPFGASVPLRLAGALHGLVLDGADPGLARAYAGAAGLDDDALWQAVAAALARHAGRIDRWLDGPPQTNEVRRSAALIAAGHWIAARTGLPLALSELGASAGLNLIWDRYALDLPGGLRLGPPDPALVLAPDWAGPPPPAAALRITDRAGVDLAPLDPGRDLPRLLAYVWPDQPDRLARTRAAAETAARLGATVARGDAADWLAARLAAPRPGVAHVVFHTIAWQYFPAETQARCTALLAAAGARATADAPLAHLGMEADDSPRGAGLVLRLWPGGAVLPLARVDFHGRWVDWQAPPLPGPVPRLS